MKARHAALALLPLLAGCIEGVAYGPSPVEFQAGTPGGEAPPPVTLTVTNDRSEPLTVKLQEDWFAPLNETHHPDHYERPWVHVRHDGAEHDPDYPANTVETFTVAPGEARDFTLHASPCRKPGPRSGGLAIRASTPSESATTEIPVSMDCGPLAPDVYFAEAAGYQGVRIGPTGYDVDHEVPIIESRPGGFRAEVASTFCPWTEDPEATPCPMPEGRHFNVEAVAHAEDGREIRLARTRDPYDARYDMRQMVEGYPYAEAHEWKAPAWMFNEGADVTLRIIPDPDWPQGEIRGNNEVVPLAGEVRLPERLPDVTFVMMPVTFTLDVDGEKVFYPIRPLDHLDCPPSGSVCMANTLDVLPLPMNTTHIVDTCGCDLERKQALLDNDEPLDAACQVPCEPIDIGDLNWEGDHDGQWSFGLSLEVMDAALEKAMEMGLTDAPREKRVIVTMSPSSSESLNPKAPHGKNGGIAGIGLTSTQALVKIDDWNYIDGGPIRTTGTPEYVLAHEIAHVFGALHGYFITPESDFCNGVLGNFGEWGTDCRWPYTGTGLVSNDPDGQGPLHTQPILRQRPDLGANIKVVDFTQVRPVPQFVAAKLLIDDGIRSTESFRPHTPAGDLMATGKYPEPIREYIWDRGAISDYHYMKTLFGLAIMSGAGWDDTQMYEPYITALPWRQVSSPRIQSKSDRATLHEATSSDRRPQVQVFGVFSLGKFTSPPTALLAFGRPGPQSRNGSHQLVAHDSSGSEVHRQPLALTPIPHAEGFRRYSATIPRADVASIEIRDQDGNVLTSAKVRDITETQQRNATLRASRARLSAPP